MPYYSTKRYGHERGLSCAYRQHKADSHCRLVHGYSLAFEFTFGAHELDVRNWVVDFGGLKTLEQWLRNTFDHTVLVAEDDPALEWFREGERQDLLRLVVVESGGCERFAELAFRCAQLWLEANGEDVRCWVQRVTVYEHGANSATIELGKGQNDV